MDEERKVVIPQVIGPWGYLVAAGVVSICLVIILVSIDYGERIGWISAALMGGTILIAIGNLMWRGLMKIVAGPEGVSAGGRQIAAEDIRTIVRIYICRGKGSITQLVISSQDPGEMEATGERKLSKRPFVRNEIKVQKGRSDWGDVCLRYGMDRRRTVWVEYAPDREDLLRRMYPHAQYRVAKYYHDPPVPK